MTRAYRTPPKEPVRRLNELCARCGRTAPWKCGFGRRRCPPEPPARTSGRLQAVLEFLKGQR